MTLDRCLATCPDGSYPTSTNPPHCQCQDDLVLNSVGDQCVQSKLESLSPYQKIKFDELDF